MSSPFELPQLDFPSMMEFQSTPNARKEVKQSGFVRPLATLGNENLPPRKIQKKTKSSLTQEKATCSQNTEQSTCCLTMPREQLLVTSRAEFDDFVKRQTNGRKLTKEERKEVARQRQLIKNRITAANSRQRKKEYQTQLETKCAELTKSEAELREKVAALEAENEKMKQDLSFFHSFVGTNSVTSGLINSIKTAKKQIEMATPAMITAAKYILLFFLVIHLAFAFSMSSGTQIPLATKSVEWYTPVVDSLANAPPLLRKDEFSSSSPSSPTDEPWIPDIEPHVPTLMPPKQEPQYESLPTFTEQMQNKSKNEKELEFNFVTPNYVPAPVPFDSEKTEESSSSVIDFNSLNIDELLASSNGTFAFSDEDLSFEYWESLFSSIATENSLEICQQSSSSLLTSSPN